MKLRALTGKDLFAWAATRVALGVGIGFLRGRQLSDRAAKRAGLALLAFGALTTLPLAIHFRKGHQLPVGAPA